MGPILEETNSSVPVTPASLGLLGCVVQLYCFHICCPDVSFLSGGSEHPEGSERGSQGFLKASFPLFQMLYEGQGKQDRTVGQSPCNIHPQVSP